MKMKREPINKWWIYFIWLVISIFLVFVSATTKQFIVNNALWIVLILFAKDIVWDIILKKYSTRGFEHAPFLAVVIFAHLVGYIALTSLVFWLFVVDLALDLLCDFEVIP